MRDISVFFGKDVGYVKITTDVVDCDVTIVDGFPDDIFLNLDVAETFGRHIDGPLYAGSIVVIYDDGIRRDEKGKYVEVEEDVADVLESFGAFVNRTDFCFGGTTGGE